MNNKDLTIVITTYRSEKKIFSCLNSIDKQIKIIVVENSNNSSFKNNLEGKYKNLNCILMGGNHGYAKSNNAGLSQVKTKYALVLNPDTIIEENAIENFFSTASKKPDFTLIGPGYDNNNKESDQQNNILDVKNIKGHAIFINMAKFVNKNFFDENYFLYFEDIDLCRKVKNENGKIFQDFNIKITHFGAESVYTGSEFQLEKNRNWHWMWSTFYYHRKNFGYLFALLVIIPKFFSAILKLIFHSIILSKKKTIYLFRIKGIINGVFGKESWYRPSLD